MRNCILGFEESSKPLSAIFDAVAKAPSEMISVDRVGDAPDNPYRLAGRNHADNKGGDSGEVEHLSGQLEELPLLSPIIVVDHGAERGLLIASGVKRLRAVKMANIPEIAAKVLKFDELFNGESAKWSNEKKRALLAEALKNVTHTESWTNTKLTDESVLSLFRTIKENYGFSKVSDFSKVMKRVGIKREDSIYRNARRLWGVAVNDRLFEQVGKTIPLSIAKRDDIQDDFALLQDENKIDALLKLFDIYADSLCHEDSDNRGKALVEMKKFESGKVVTLIKQVKDEGNENIDDAYAEPRFPVDFRDGSLTVPKIDQFTLSDVSRKNIARVVEIHYNLTSICGQIETFLKAVRPEDIGEKIDRSKVPNISIQAPNFDQGYLDFVNRWNMQWYCNIQKVEKFLEKAGIILAEEHTKRRAEKEGRLDQLLFEKFIEIEQSKK